MLRLVMKVIFNFVLLIFTTSIFWGCSSNPSNNISGVSSFSSKEGIDVIRSAEAGESFAQFVMGYSYERGVNKKQDYKKAAFWYEKAADQGLARAQYRLALLNMMGVIDGKEFKTPFAKKINDVLRTSNGRKLYTAAAMQGHAPAQYELGVFHMGMNPVRRVDFLESYAWFSVVSTGNSEDRNNAKKYMAKIAAKLSKEQANEAINRAKQYRFKISGK